MTGRRSPAMAVVTCALGGLVILLASGRHWTRGRVVGPAVGGQTTLSASGHVVAPSLPAIGLAMLALAAAIIASSGVVRRVVGIVIVLVSAAAVGVSTAAPGDASRALRHHESGVLGEAVNHVGTNGWWVVATIGGVLGVVAGLLTVFRATAWSQMSAKYDAPGSDAARGTDATAGAVSMTGATATSPATSANGPTGANGATGATQRPAKDPAVVAWDALDRGEDPTIETA